MPESGKTSFQIVFRHADLIKAREAEHGAYFGDGPTSDQLDTLIEKLQPICEATEALPVALLAAFRGALSVEMTWLFPERDPLAEAMTEALRDIETFTGKAIESVLPEMHDDLEKIVTLSIVENAALRRQATHGNKIIWRLVLARILYRVGKFLSG